VVLLTGNPSTTAGVAEMGDYSAVSLDPSSTGIVPQTGVHGLNEKIIRSVWGSWIARIGFCN
jgi:hypothetical protein